MPSRISGEALTTQRLYAMGFGREFIGRDLAGGDLSTMKLFQEFGARQVGKLGGLSLRDDPLREPLNRRGDIRISLANSPGAKRNAPKADASKSKVIVVVMASPQVVDRSQCRVKVMDSVPIRARRAARCRRRFRVRWRSS